MSKIIFLDFDGVLNSVGTKDRITHPIFGHRIRGLDDFRVKLVSDLAVESGASIVISSTWREHFELPYLNAILYKRGMRGNIIDQTPKAYQEIGWGFDKMRLERGDEIAAWLRKNEKPESILVLDDLPTQFKRYQIQTNDGTGFFAGHMKKARRILSTVYDPDDLG